MKVRTLFLTVLAVLTSTTANADVLCIKTSQSVNKSKVNLSSVIKISNTDKCLKGYKSVLDTSSFKGERGISGSQGERGLQGLKGDTGLPALSHSTCQKRHKQFNTVIDDAHRTFNISKICESGEYAYGFKVEGTSVYSNDWSLDGYADDAGSSNYYVNGNAELRLASKVYDDDDMFLVGYKGNADYSNYTTITGNLSETYDVTLTCCLLGD